MASRTKKIGFTPMKYGPHGCRGRQFLSGGVIAALAGIFTVLVPFGRSP